MRIKEFSIREYGPLTKTGRIELGGFNLFFGRNENGKTLTIDALIKLLIGKRAKDFKQADRVETDPDGTLILSLDGSKTEKELPADGDLAKITKELDVPLTAADCRNIFIIRNSELSLSNESVFYTGLTDRLVGLRTNDIKKIKKNLMEIGRLTPAFSFRDDEKSLKLKDRLDKARELAKVMEKGKAKLLELDFDKLEMDFYRKSKELSRLNEQIRLYEEARDRDRFEKSSELMAVLEKRINDLAEMDIYREEDYRLWQDCSREIERSNKEIADLRNNINTLNPEIKVLKDKAGELKVNVDILEKRKFYLDEEKSRLRDIKSAYAEFESDSSLAKLLKKISYVSTVITIIIISAWLINNSSFILAAGILSVIVNVLAWGFEIVHTIKIKRVIRAFNDVKYILSEHGIKAESIQDALSALGKFYADIENMKMKYGELESGIAAAARHLKEYEEKINEYKSIIDSEEKRILEVRTISGLRTLEEYKDLLDIKKKKQKERDDLSSRLEGMLGVHGIIPAQNINLLKSRIKELEHFKDRGTGIGYNQEKYEEIKSRAFALQEKLKEVGSRIEQIRDGMGNFEARANDIFVDSGERLYCKTLVDLEEIFKRLNNFIEDNDRRRDDLKDAFDLLNNIELKEKERVLELFNSDGLSVSHVFSMITGGLYNEVIYDREGEHLKVKRNSGEIIDAEKLSGGAYDQLYLAIRIALGEKLLHSEKGFFILDDPFIKSDIQRIERQIDTLKKIHNMGWQIIYFSCKNEIKDVLLDDINSGKINYVNINWLN